MHDEAKLNALAKTFAGCVWLCVESLTPEQYDWIRESSLEVMKVYANHIHVQAQVEAARQQGKRQTPEGHLWH